MPFKGKWTAEDRVKIVMESLETDTSLTELCKKYEVTPGTFYKWAQKFVAGGKAGLYGGLRNEAPQERSAGTSFRKGKRRRRERRMVEVESCPDCWKTFSSIIEVEIHQCFAHDRHWLCQRPRRVVELDAQLR